jgi:peptide/nickel transport system substrate-binding protein
MNTMKKSAVLLLLAIMMMFFLPYAGRCDFPIDRLTAGTVMNVKGVDINDYYYGVLRGMLTHLGLVLMDEKGEFRPSLAESWTTGDGGTWTFALRKNVVWHDSQPVTAHDVAFTIAYLPEIAPVYKSHLGMVRSVSVPDPHTVVIQLTHPCPRFLVNLMVVRILPRHIFESTDRSKMIPDKEAAVGCGPYMLDTFDRASGTITFRAFPKYYRGLPNIREIVFRSFRNPDVMMMALQKGEIDIPYFYSAGTPVHLVPPLLKNKDIKIQRIANTGVPNALFFNTQKPPLDQADFRRALSLSINYEEIIRFFAAGYGEVPRSGFLPVGTPEFVETPVLAYDPKQAVNLLEGLGYKDTGSDGVRRAGEKIAGFELVVRTDIPGSLRLTELLKEYFQKIGVRLTLKPVDMAAFSKMCDQERSYMALLSRATAWGMMMWGGCGSGYLDHRDIGWSPVQDKDFLSIVDEMNKAMDRDRYRKAAALFQEYNARALFAVPLYFDVLVQPFHRRFEGWRVSPIYGFLWEETWFHLRETDIKN